MLSQFRGLVLAENPWGESDKILTVLTAEAGKISVLLKGGASLRNKSAASCIPFCFSEFVTADRGGRPWVREVSEIESFPRIRKNLELTSAALYICDVAGDVCVENSDESEMLQLVLNTLYALDRGLRKRDEIKAAFELRTAAVCGFSPDLVRCSECGKSEAEVMFLDVMDGVLQCENCRRRQNSLPPREGHSLLLFQLEKPLLDVMRYVCYSNAKKFLSFDLPARYADRFYDYCEKYLLSHVEKNFRTLDFLHSLKAMPEISVKSDRKENDSAGTEK